MGGTLVSPCTVGSQSMAGNEWISSVTKSLKGGNFYRLCVSMLGTYKVNGAGGVPDKQLFSILKVVRFGMLKYVGSEPLIRLLFNSLFQLMDACQKK
jgi:hypothetical protein